MSTKTASSRSGASSADSSDRAIRLRISTIQELALALERVRAMQMSSHYVPNTIKEILDCMVLAAKHLSGDTESTNSNS